MPVRIEETMPGKQTIVLERDEETKFQDLLKAGDTPMFTVKSFDVRNGRNIGTTTNPSGKNFCEYNFLYKDTGVLKVKQDEENDRILTFTPQDFAKGIRWKASKIVKIEGRDGTQYYKDKESLLGMELEIEDTEEFPYRVTVRDYPDFDQTFFDLKHSNFSKETPEFFCGVKFKEQEENERQVLKDKELKGQQELKSKRYNRITRYMYLSGMVLFLVCLIMLVLWLTRDKDDESDEDE